MSRTPGETQCEQSKLFGILDLYRSYSLLVTFLAAFLLMINDVLLLVPVLHPGLENSGLKIPLAKKVWAFSR